MAEENLEQPQGEIQEEQDIGQQQQGASPLNRILEKVQLIKEKIARVFSSNQGKTKLIVLVSIIGVVGFGLYLISSDVKDNNKDRPDISSPSQDKQAKHTTKRVTVTSPKESAYIAPNTSSQTTEKLSLPPLKQPDAPPLPPPPTPSAPSTPILPKPAVIESENKKVEKQGVIIPSIGEIVSVDKKSNKISGEKMKSSMMVFGGAGGGGDAKKEPASTSKTSEFLGFDNGMIENNELSTSNAPTVEATVVRNLDYTIVQGKVIDAVLETAISTEIPGGLLRAIVSRDVYSDKGNNILIPKGSRLVGTYETNVTVGQSRVNVLWNRVITPNGIDVNLSSPASDTLGRAGVIGYADDQWMAKLANAFLVSYIIPTQMVKWSGQGDTQITITTGQGGTPTNSSNNSNNSSNNSSGNNSLNTTTTNTTLNAQVTQNALKELQNIISQTITEKFNMKNTIIVDQGTKITIIVNKDLVFAKNQKLK